MDRLLIFKNIEHEIFKIVHHPIFFPAIIGIILRILLSLFTSWTYDTVNLYKTGMSIIGGFGIYDKPYMAIPPVWIYILGFSIKIGGLFFDPRNFAVNIQELDTLKLLVGMISTTVTSPTFNLLFKLPLIISDFVIGYILYTFITEISGDTRIGEQGFLLWFLNPLVILVSGVHGRFESILTLFLLLTIILIYKKNYFWAGMVWMFGILTKLSPIYFLPLILGYIFSIEFFNGEFRILTIIKKCGIASAQYVSGSVIAFLVVSLPLFFSGTLYGINLAVSKREETGITVGGISPWIIRDIPQYSWVFDWAYNHPAIVLKYSYIVAFSFLFALGIVTFFLGYQNPLKALFYGATMTLSIVYLTAPLVNPSYLVWIFPFLIFISLIFDKGHEKLLAIITLSGIIFFISLMGIWNLLIPIAEYTNILSVDSIIELTKLYWLKNGFYNYFLRDDLQLVSGAIGVMGIFLCLFPRKISYSIIIKEIYKHIFKLVDIFRGAR